MTDDPSILGAHVPRHHFTVDVEEYFHPTALVSNYPSSGWSDLPRRTPEVVPRILDFLAERDTRGTFFVLGWLAEREPDIVRRIRDEGHELASHGYEHELVGRLGPRGFRESVRRAKEVIEGVAAVPVRGYRAPSFSIVPGLEWAFDVLIEEGFEYDASLFPVAQHPTYGYPSAPPDPFWVRRPSGRIAEFPSTTARVGNSRLPASGGAYFRLLPPMLVRAGLRQAEARGAPGMFYIHPWEMDEWAPAVEAPRLQRFRTFGGRTRTWGRLHRLFEGFRFIAVDTTLAEMVSSEGTGIVERKL